MIKNLTIKNLKEIKNLIGDEDYTIEMLSLGSRKRIRIISKESLICSYDIDQLVENNYSFYVTTNANNKTCIMIKHREVK